MGDSEFEVVKSNVDGWEVRRVGEVQPLTNHATKEEAEEAARVQATLGQDDDKGATVDVRQDVFSEPEDGDVSVKKTALAFTAMVLAVIALLVVLSLIVSMTGFGGA
jgi:flagellar biosynthesis/type III secretory pathway M-ring protein FliF/YscJ